MSVDTRSKLVLLFLPLSDVAPVKCVVDFPVKFIELDLVDPVLKLVELGTESVDRVLVKRLLFVSALP